MMPTRRSGYVADAHDDAWERVFAFFAKHVS
jgi:dienelactone hydrolase